MKILITIAVIFLSYSVAFGQGAFDSSCYYPQMGNPNELDTIYGRAAYQHLGGNLRTFPPLKGQQYDQLAFQGMPGNIPFLTTMETHPSFNLHNLKVTKKLDYENIPAYKRGHFRSPHITDLFYDASYGGHPMIYWADEYGEFDSTRYTSIIPNGINGRGVGCDFMSAYATYLTSDTVEDIIVSMNIALIPQDSIFMAFVQGGQHLYDNGQVAWWDEKVFWGIPEDSAKGPRSDSNYRWLITGDWRGTGRDDCIGVDYRGNYYYYRNDQPFSLEGFVHSLRYDTIMVTREWSLHDTKFIGGGDGMSMVAFPKQTWDKSQDLLVPLPLEVSLDGENDNGICIFKGGPDFGNKRLHLDSADFFLHCPGYYSGVFSRSHWTIGGDLGDLTGTGNPVLLTSEYKGVAAGSVCMYVLGKAIDDKIDVFYPINNGGGSADMIVATNKGYKSFIAGSPAYQTPEDQDRGIFEKGRIELLKGVEKIPIRLNPKYSVEEQGKLDTSVHHIVAYPNPCDQKTVLTFNNCTGDKMLVDVINAKGEVCQSEVTPSGYGLQEYAVFLNSQPTGTYHIRLTCPRDGWSATTNVVKTGVYQTPWNLDLRKIMGR